jgi:hypothetical protein
MNHRLNRQMNYELDQLVLVQVQVQVQVLRVPVLVQLEEPVLHLLVD